MPILTTRQQRACDALARRVERDHRLGRPIAGPAPVPELRVSPRGLSMPWEAFKRADYGRLCQMLGLSPSRPHKSASR